MNQASEIRLDTTQGALAGLAWRREGAPRVLCLHGWLDNAASFVPLAPLLDRLDVVALDLPGHGHSEHRHPIRYLECSCIQHTLDPLIVKFLR